MSDFAKMASMAGFLGGGGIAVPASAEVGQTIVVKAVDEKGKPTEWETTAPQGVETLLDFTTEETVTEINCYLPSAQAAQKLKNAGVFFFELFVPRDAEDTETTTEGTVNVYFEYTYYPLLKDVKAICAPTSTWITGRNTYVVGFPANTFINDTVSYKNNAFPIILWTSAIGGTNMSISSLGYANPYFHNISENTKIVISATQKMPAGTNVKIGVIK